MARVLCKFKGLHDASMSGRMHDMQDEFDVATPINKYKQQREQEGGFHRVHPRIHNGVAIE